MGNEKQTVDGNEANMLQDVIDVQEEIKKHFEQIKVLAKATAKTLDPGHMRTVNEKQALQAEQKVIACKVTISILYRLKKNLLAEL
jgi:hypothetical protein